MAKVKASKIKSSDYPGRLDLAPIVSLTMAEAVELKMEEYLRTKDLKVGDPLPKEIELSQALGVSRNVIREALSRFRMLGIIESRKKRGMVLTSPDILGGIQRVLHPRFMSEESLRDIFEMRLVLEMGMADLLFLRKTGEDVAELERLVNASKIKRVTSQFKLESEIEFHGKLYSICGNSTMKRFQNMLLPVFEYVLSYESILRKPRKVGSATHEDLVKQLKRGSPESFRKTMHKHLEPHFALLELWNKADKS